MATVESSRRFARADYHRTFAEEVALMLSLVIISMLGLAVLCLLTLEFLGSLPTWLAMTVTLSLIVFGVVLGRAMFERAVSVPAVYRGMTPVVRHHD